MRTPEQIEYSLDGRRLSAVRWAGTGVPLVLLPGAGGNALLFGDLAAAVGNREIIAIDPPGLGGSDEATSHDLGEFADALAATAGSEFTQPAVWVGHSWGGKVSAILAARHPALAAATILIDPSPVSPLPMDDEALTRFAESIWDGSGGPWPSDDAAIDSLQSRRHYQRWTPNLEAALRRNLVRTPRGSTTIRCSRDDLYAVADATLRVDYTSDVACLACPSLYLVASESLWWQELSNDRVLPDHVERVEIEGQHFLYLDQPENVVDEILRFLADHGL